MEQEPTPVIELIRLVLLLGSITFLLGATFQAYVLWMNKKSLLKSLATIALTRILTLITSFFIWSLWDLPLDVVFLFIFMPAVLPELIFSPLILKLFGNRIFKIKKTVHNIR